MKKSQTTTKWRISRIIQGVLFAVSLTDYFGDFIIRRSKQSNSMYLIFESIDEFEITIRISDHDMISGHSNLSVVDSGCSDMSIDDSISKCVDFIYKYKDKKYEDIPVEKLVNNRIFNLIKRP